MGRILVLLTFAGLAAAFLIIYNASNKPAQSGTVSNSNASKQGNSRTTKPSQVEKAKHASSAGAVYGRKIGAVSGRKNRNPSKSATDPTEATTPPTPNKAPAGNSDDKLITVKNNSTPVYSANTKHSKVLRQLRRGDRLRPDLEVIDSEGRWNVVKGKEKEKPGFVRDDQIERPQKDPSSSKNQQIPKR